MNYDMFDEIDYFSNVTDNNFPINNQNEFNMNKELNLYSPYEGYIKGNLFKNLYDGYKNFKPKRINISSEKEEMLLNINQITFASHELNLFLDNYPNNKEALNLFNRYTKIANEEIKNYERRYGPLCVGGEMNNNTPFAWENEKWPWEM